MEGERKKRKIDNEEGGGGGGGRGEGEGDEDEEKMEKFFALIRSTREVRNRLRSGVNESKDKEEKSPIEKEIKTTAVWNPNFQPEDFTGEDKPKSPGASTQPGPSKREEKEEDDRGDGKGLDLNLSL